MTHEERATWIKRIFVFGAAVAIVAAVIYNFDLTEDPKPPEVVGEKVEKGNPSAAGQASNGQGVGNTMSGASNSDGEDPLSVTHQGPAKSVEPLSIFHHHLPGEPSSEALADVFNHIKVKYAKLVTVTRVDIRKQAEFSKGQGVTKAPHVVMFIGTEKVFEFHGFWSQVRVDQKVEELLAGLERVGKDWRPSVPGMKRVGS